MPMGVGTPCKKHGYPYLDPCLICTHEENEALRNLVLEQDEAIKESIKAMAVGCRFRAALERIESDHELNRADCAVLAAETIHPELIR